MRVFHSRSLIFSIISDVFVIFFSLCLSLTILSLYASPQITLREFYLLIALVVIWFFASKNLGIYDEFRSRNFSFEIVLVLKAAIFQVITMIVILYALKAPISRLVVVYYGVLLVILSFFSKLIIRKLLNYIRTKGRNIRNILIIGGGKVGNRFYKTINGNPHYGYKIVGILDDKKNESMDGEYIGPISELNNILSEIKIDNVIVALPSYAYKKVEEILNVCSRYTTRVKIIPDYFKLPACTLSASMFGSFPIFSVNEYRINEYHWRIIKRLVDIAFSLAVIVFILSWIMPLTAILQLLFDKGPLFFKARRWGMNSDPFYCYKFRSMRKESTNHDVNGKHIPTTVGDRRITKLGNFLRKSNIDELPQFINVLLGDMSIVGPRPHDEYENMDLREKINLYMWRHLVKPGITGWAQVNGFRGGTKNIDLMKRRTEYDLWYIQHWSGWLDFQIVLLTVWKMIKGDPKAY